MNKPFKSECKYSTFMFKKKVKTKKTDQLKTKKIYKQSNLFSKWVFYHV